MARWMESQIFNWMCKFKINFMRNVIWLVSSSFRSRMEEENSVVRNCGRKTLNCDLIIHLTWYRLDDWCESWWWLSFVSSRRKFFALLVSLGLGLEFTMSFNIFNVFGGSLTLVGERLSRTMGISSGENLDGIGERKVFRTEIVATEKIEFRRKKLLRWVIV